MADETTPQARPLVTWATAQVSGSKRYFTGNPCCRGHVAERWTSVRACVVCTKSADNYEINRVRFRERHRKEAAEVAAKWRSDNPEKATATRRAYVSANKGKIAAAKAVSYLRHAAGNRAAARVRYAANKQAVQKYNAKYNRENRALVRAIRANRRARSKAAEGSHTAADIASLYSTQRMRCASPWCRKSLSVGYHVDHVVPLALGGSNRKRNLQLLCPSCNLRKWAKNPIDFAQQNGMLL